MDKTKIKCEKCGGEMVEKTGRFGPFTACSNFPDCKNILKSNKVAGPAPEKTGEKCDKCGEGEFVIRDGKFGKFKACSRFPQCKNTQKIEEKTKTG